MPEHILESSPRTLSFSDAKYEKLYQLATAARLARSEYIIDRLSLTKYLSLMQWITLAASTLPLLWSGQLVREIRLARRLRETGVEVIGRIVRQRRVSDRSGRYTIPTIGFTTSAGQPIEGESQRNARNQEFFDGDEVCLSYDPARPTCFLLAQELTSTRLYWWLAAASITSAVSLIVACK